MLYKVAQMIQLSYDSAYDPYHTIFRILRICMYDKSSKFLIQQIRIFDFYLNFPHFLERFTEGESYKLPRGGRELIKKINLENYSRPYGDLPTDKILFRQMESIQSGAMQTLCIRNIAIPHLFKQGYLQILENNIPDELKDSIIKRNYEQKELIDFIVNFLGKIKFYGVDGLKARTHLLEYKYDKI